MKKILMKLLLELLKDSKRSDRELAKALGVSQPTVTRMRKKLVDDGLIQQYTIIPDFAKMGYELMAISCFKSKVKEELRERAKKLAKANPNIIFAAGAQGMGKNGVVISLHKNYTDYTNFFTALMEEGGEDIKDYDTLLISLGGVIIKSFSLKYLAELEETS